MSKLQIGSLIREFRLKTKLTPEKFVMNWALRNLLLTVGKTNALNLHGWLCKGFWRCYSGWVSAGNFPPRILANLRPKAIGFTQKLKIKQVLARFLIIEAIAFTLAGNLIILIIIITGKRLLFVLKRFFIIFCIML